jgi:hypothetical protein
MSLGVALWASFEVQVMVYGSGDWHINGLVHQGGENHHRNFAATVPLASGTDRWITAAELADMRGKVAAMAASLIGSTLDQCPID